MNAGGEGDGWDLNQRNIVSGVDAVPIAVDDHIAARYSIGDFSGGAYGSAQVDSDGGDTGVKNGYNKICKNFDFLWLTYPLVQ